MSASCFSTCSGASSRGTKNMPARASVAASGGHAPSDNEESMCSLVQMRRMLFLAAAIVVTATTHTFAADAWPQRPVRFIVPFGPGSSPDVAAWLFGERLRERWHQPVVIENRPGADGVIGTAAFAAMPDDHVLLFSPAAPITVYPLIQDK